MRLIDIHSKFAFTPVIAADQHPFRAALLCNRRKTRKITIPVVVCGGWRLTSRCYLMHTQLLLICASVSLIVDKLSRFAAAPVVEEEGLQAKSVKNQGSNQCWMFSSVART